MWTLAPRPAPQAPPKLDKWSPAMYKICKGTAVTTFSALLQACTVPHGERAASWVVSGCLTPSRARRTI
jgi:hypothetical protein